MRQPISELVSTEDDGFVFMYEITHDLKMTDRGVRKWITAGRFPRPDGNLNGRNFWKASTYRRWKADALAGKFDRPSTLRRPQPAAAPAS